MSKEILTPISDSYHGAPGSTEELPEHLRLYGEDWESKGYASIWHKPGATKAEKDAHEAEIALVWQANKDLEDVFRAVSSEEFNEAHMDVAAYGMKAQVATRQLLKEASVRGESARRQTNIETHLALEQEAVRQAEKLLPITEDNVLHEHRVLRQREVLIELLLSDIHFLKNGKDFRIKHEAFEKNLADWRKYEQLAFAAEIEMLHEQALKENKKYNAKKFRSHHKQKFEAKDLENGGLFGQIWGLPLDRYDIAKPDGDKTSLYGISKAFAEAQPDFMKKDEVKAIIDGSKADKIDGAGIANRALASKYLAPALGAIEENYKAQGLSGDDLEEALDEAAEILQNWLTDAKAREDYTHYDRSRTVYELRSRKAGKFTLRLPSIGDYIGNLRIRTPKPTVSVSVPRASLPVEVRTAMSLRPVAGRSTPRARSTYTTPPPAKKRRRLFGRNSGPTPTP